MEDNQFIEPPYTPEEGYHVSKDLADQEIRMLRDQNSSSPSKPWFTWDCHARHDQPYREAQHECAVRATLTEP